MKTDPAIEVLLDLDGATLNQSGGYWIKIEARRVNISKEIPHGIRYSLSLHDSYGKRILGYDNAHAVKPPKKHRHASKSLAHDHKHRHFSDHGVPYEFKSTQQLINDFFADVNRILGETR